MMNNKLQAAKEYANNGYKVFPLVPNDKKPKITEWQSKASNDPKQIERWWFDYPNANIGVLTGELVVLDVDVKDGAKEGPLNLDRGGYEIPNDSPLIRTPSKGQHFYFKTRNGSVIKNNQDYPVDDVDIRGSGGYIVGVGSSVDGIEYTGDVKPLTELPEAPEWLIKPVFQPIVRASNAQGSAAYSALPSPQINDIQTALDMVDPEKLTEEEWRNVGMAIQSELPDDEGLELFDTWSQKDPDRYRNGDCAARWRSWNPNGGIGIGTLYKMADFHPIAKQVFPTGQVFNDLTKGDNTTSIITTLD